MTVVDEDGVEAVAAYLGDRVGLRVTGSRQAHLLREIAAAMDHAGASTASWFCARLDADPQLFDAVVARVTVGESYFFREPGQLAALRDIVLPDRLAARGKSSPLRIWSAGCAIGQEAYTLAMLLEEAGLDATARIIATDISAEALRVASAGVYGRWSLRAVSDRQRADHFDEVAMGHRVAERHLRRVTFRQHNLLDPDASLSNMDVILCRNVLIYFDAGAVERAATNLTNALAPGGWLITASSDPSLGALDGIEAVPTPAGVLYRRVSAAAVTWPRPTAKEGDVSARPAGVPRQVVTRLRPTSGRSHRPSAASAPPTQPPRESVEATPRSTRDVAEALMAKIRSLGGSGALDAALDTAASAIEQLPLRPELRLLEAVVLLEAGRPLDARSSARAALYLDPDMAMAHLVCARAEAGIGGGVAARRSLHRARALLEAMPPDAIVPLSDGEVAGRLLAMVTTHDEALIGAEEPRGARR